MALSTFASGSLAGSGTSSFLINSAFLETGADFLTKIGLMASFLTAVFFNSTFFALMMGLAVLAVTFLASFGFLVSDFLSTFVSYAGSTTCYSATAAFSS